MTTCSFLFPGIFSQYLRLTLSHPKTVKMAGPFLFFSYALYSLVEAGGVVVSKACKVLKIVGSIPAAAIIICCVLEQDT